VLIQLKKRNSSRIMVFLCEYLGSAGYWHLEFSTTQYRIFQYESCPEISVCTFPEDSFIPCFTRSFLASLPISYPPVITLSNDTCRSRHTPPLAPLTRCPSTFCIVFFCYAWPRDTVPCYVICMMNRNNDNALACSWVCLL
jgi:hypothetical protein